MGTYYATCMICCTQDVPPCGLCFGVGMSDLSQSVTLLTSSVDAAEGIGGFSSCVSSNFGSSASQPSSKKIVGAYSDQYLSAGGTPCHVAPE